MRKIRNAMAVIVLAGAVASGTYAFFASPLVPTAQAKWHEHPKLEGAFNSLKEAKEYLVNSPDRFHGHKAEAIQAIDVAMKHLRICAEEEATPALTPDFDKTPLAEHPKLHEAREHLKEARDYLHEAPHDFHGHREEAIKAIDVAIKEIDKCME